MDTTQSAESRPLLDIGHPQASPQQPVPCDSHPSDSSGPRKVVGPPYGKPSNAASSAVPAQPPAYRPPEPLQIMRPTNQKYKEGEPTLIPRGEPVLDANGQPMQIQRGTILEPRVRDHYMNPPIIPVVVGYQMGPEPASTTCTYCQAHVITRTEGKTTIKTHMIAAFFGFMCLWPCVVLAYHMDTFRNTDHYCPNCNKYIGSYVR